MKIYMWKLLVDSLFTRGNCINFVLGFRGGILSGCFGILGVGAFIGMRGCVIGCFGVIEGDIACNIRLIYELSDRWIVYFKYECSGENYQ